MKRLSLSTIAILLVGVFLVLPVLSVTDGNPYKTLILPGEERGLRNLATGGTASATFYQTKSEVCPPSNVNDGDVTTRWSTYGADSFTPHAISIDLKKECGIDLLNLLFMDVRRSFTFDVYVTHEPLIENSKIKAGQMPILSGQKGQGSSPDSPTFTTVDFNRTVTGRYVTLNIVSSSSNSAGDNPVVAMYEFAVMGKPLSSEGDEIVSFLPIGDIFVPAGTALSSLSLPQTAQAELADGRVESLQIRWEMTTGQSVSETTELTGIPVIPEGLEVKNSQNRKACLQVKVCESEPDGRMQYSLNEDWRFCKGDLAGGEAKDLSESAFAYVSLPHTWNAQDGADGGNNYYQGPGWYRRTLRWYMGNASQRVYLYFEGVSRVCEVFVNGQSIAVHKGAYTAFYADLTNALAKGDNQIAVRVDNTITEEVATLVGDFTQYGGIYRDVSLIVTGQTHLDTSYGSENFDMIPVSVSKNSARIEVAATIKNDSGVSVEAQAGFVFRVPKQGSLVWIEEIPRDLLPFEPDDMTSPDGEILYQLNRKLTLEPYEKKEVRFTFDLSSPRLWNGLSDPFRYEGEMTVTVGGKVTDSVRDYCGLRTFSVDASKGAFLNGVSYNLRGVSRHQDRAGLGSALTQKEHNEDFALIYEMGANAVRLAHYPQSDYFYSLCDQYGILVWAENAFVNHVGGDGTYEAPDATRALFMENVREQLTELIRQQINRPSIVVWGIQNEVDPSYVSFMKSFCRELTELCHTLDPTRPVTQATANGSNSGWPSDLICTNLYPGWYYSDYTQLKRYIDTFRSQANGRPVGISEYGAGANYEQHCEGIPAVVCKADIPFQYEEYQAEAHESYLSQIAQMDYLWCTFVWNMFDFGSDARNEAQISGINNKGLVSFDRAVKKDAFYLYRANWSKLPTLHICSSRFTLREKKEIAVKIYSNCDQVTLYVNGTPAGTVLSDQTEQSTVFIWDSIRLQGGRNEVRAVGTIQGQTVKDEAVWYYLVPESDFYKIDSQSRTITIPSTGALVQNLARDLKGMENAQATAYDSARKTEIKSGPVREGMILQIVSDGKSAEYVFTRTNIAKGARADASFEQSGHEAKMATDGSLASYWSTYGTTSLPQSITLDLGDVYPIAELKLMFFGSGRVATYDVYVSENGPNPDKVLISNAKGHGYGASGGLSEDARYESVLLPEGTSGRYIKVVVKGSEPAVTLAAIWEIEVYTSLQGSVHAPDDLMPEVDPMPDDPSDETSDETSNETEKESSPAVSEESETVPVSVPEKESESDKTQSKDSKKGCGSVTGQTFVWLSVLGGACLLLLGKAVRPGDRDKQRK